MKVVRRRLDLRLRRERRTDATRRANAAAQDVCATSRRLIGFDHCLFSQSWPHTPPCLPMLDDLQLQIIRK